MNITIFFFLTIDPISNNAHSDLHRGNIETRNLSVRWTDMKTSCHRDSSFEWDKRVNGPQSWITRQKDNSYNRVNGKKSRNMGCGEERETLPMDILYQGYRERIGRKERDGWHWTECTK